MQPACGLCAAVHFLSFPWAGRGIELSHTGKNNGNPDLSARNYELEGHKKYCHLGSGQALRLYS